MNSLIQTLYMTPEFRAALYKWDFNQSYKTWVAKEAAESMEDKPPAAVEEANNKGKEDGQAPSKQLSNSSNNSGKPKTPEEIERERKVSREKVSIPRQLQLLFTRLQLREVRAVKTKVHFFFLSIFQSILLLYISLYHK